MPINTIYRDIKHDIVNLPIYGAAADVQQGAFLKAGATPATMNGALVLAAGNAAAPELMGRLAQKLVYATDGETLVAGTSFVTKPVILAHPFRIHRVEFDLTAASAIVCTQAVSTTTMTVTSLEDDIDASFLYVVSGLGAGQTNYLTASASGACTLKAAFGTSLDTTSYFIKILRRFHTLISLSADGTKIASQVAVGTIKCVIMELWIQRGGNITQLNPTKHAALTGLNSVTGLHFYADIAFRDVIPYQAD